MTVDLSLSLLLMATLFLKLFLGGALILGFQKVVNASWLEPLEPLLQPCLNLLPLIAVLSLAGFLGRDSLYPTNLPEGFPRFYFSKGFFLLRNLLYLAVWATIALKIRRRTLQWGAPVLILILLTGSFWSIDWQLALDPNFKSTAFGLVFLLSALLMTFAFVLTLIKSPLSPQVRQDLNNIHFAMIAVWTYVSFMQFLIIWAGNLPEESAWYLRRTQNSWHFVPVILGAGQCVVPLFLLLVRPWKNSMDFTRSVALISLVLQTLFTFWLLAPVAAPQGFQVSLLNGIALLSLVAFWWWQARRPV